MTAPFSSNDGQAIGSVAKACMAAPMKCFAEAWGLNETGAKAGAGASTPSNPVEAGIGSIAKMSSAQMQAQLDEGLRQDIYNI